MHINKQKAKACLEEEKRLQILTKQYNSCGTVTTDASKESEQLLNILTK